MFVHADACCKFIMVRGLEYSSVLVCDYCICVVCFVGLFVIFIFSLMTLL